MEIQSVSSLRDDSHTLLLNETFRSPDQVITKSQPIFDNTHKSFDVESEGEEEEEEVLLRWKRQGMRGSIHSLVSCQEQEIRLGNTDDMEYTHTDSDEERKRKGKGKLIKSNVKEGKRKYGTRSATQKVLGSAMAANVVQTQRRRQQRIQGLT